jgi:hypothetical protein
MPSENDALRRELVPSFLEATRVRLRRCERLADHAGEANAVALRAELQTLAGEAAMLGLGEISLSARAALTVLENSAGDLRAALERVLASVAATERTPAGTAP